MSSKEELLAFSAPFGQQHLLDFWDRLDAAQRAALEGQMRKLDLFMLGELYARRNDQADVRDMANRARPRTLF